MVGRDSVEPRASISVQRLDRVSPYHWVGGFKPPLLEAPLPAASFREQALSVLPYPIAIEGGGRPQRIGKSEAQSNTECFRDVVPEGGRRLAGGAGHRLRTKKSRKPRRGRAKRFERIVLWKDMPNPMTIRDAPLGLSPYPDANRWLAPPANIHGTSGAR